MTAVQQLEAQLADWRGKLQDAEQESTRAGLLALDGNADDAAAMLTRCTSTAEVARQAIAALEAQLPEAQARAMLAEADELSKQADELEAKATALDAEVAEIIGMARRLGVTLVQRGEPNANWQMRAQAGSFRTGAADLRNRARKLRGEPKNAAAQVAYNEGWNA